MAEDPENDALICQMSDLYSTFFSPFFPTVVVETAFCCLISSSSSSSTNCMSANPPAWAKNHIPRVSRVSMKSSRSRTVPKLWYRSIRVASPSSPSSSPTFC